jgi:hypothetical protein
VSSPITRVNYHIKGHPGLFVFVRHGRGNLIKKIVMAMVIQFFYHRNEFSSLIKTSQDDQIIPLILNVAFREAAIMA